MDFKHYSITSLGAAYKTLAEASSDTEVVYTIERLLICNTDSTSITVNLKIDNAGGDSYYLLKDMAIPVGVTLDFLNGISFNYSAEYRLSIALGDNAYTADVICNLYIK